MTAPLDPAALFRRLHQAGVRYVVIGGFAVIAHGVQRSTADLDICPDPDPANLTRLASLLRDLEARQAEAGDFRQDKLPYDPTDPEQLREGGNFRLETSLGALDIMQWIPGVTGEPAYRELAGEAINAEVRGIPVSVCSRAHLLAMKRRRSAARPCRPRSAGREGRLGANRRALSQPDADLPKERTAAGQRDFRPVSSCPGHRA